MSDRRAAALRLTGALHLGALALPLVRPDSWPLAATLVLANHGALAAASVMPRSTWLGPNLSRIDEDPAWRDRIALTFDDGPDPEVTPQVVSILAQYDSTASFFCVGEKVRTHPEIAILLHRNGHGVENHTNTHPSGFAFFGSRRAGLEIDHASAAILDTVGTAPAYFRAPAGMRNPWLAPVVEDRGLCLVSWTRRGFDAVARSPERIVHRLKRNLSQGDILLLHDGFGPRLDSGKPVVLETLPRLLESLAAEGLRASRLPA